ncbi:MAG: cyclic nucleotide-binding domain-containing protein [Gloeobacteraceae cyanobacterium ES-bin-144]|nr:cyclic nucleotide-binding domain-containing protein [Verrucomicrobiales bacterium]
MKTFSPLHDLDSVLTILSKISFLGGVSDAQREQIFRLLETGFFRKGEYVSRRGEEPSHIYIIKSGRIDLMINDQEFAVKKREFNVGACFGEAAMLSMINNTASFVAAEDTELIVLSRRAFNQLRREDEKLFCILMMNLARELARKLQYTDHMLLQYELHHEAGSVN